MGDKGKKALKKTTEWLSGDVLLNKRVDRNLGFIFYVFVLLCLLIAWSLNVEKDLVRVEKNEAVISDLKINYQQRTLDLVGLNSRFRVEELLKKNHSTLAAPSDPPKRVKIEN